MKVFQFIKSSSNLNMKEKGRKGEKERGGKEGRRKEGKGKEDRP